MPLCQAFYEVIGDPASGLHLCAAGTLPAGLSPYTLIFFNVHFCLFFLNLINSGKVIKLILHIWL